MFRLRCGHGFGDSRFFAGLGIRLRRGSSIAGNHCSVTRRRGAGRSIGIGSQIIACIVSRRFGIFAGFSGFSHGGLLCGSLSLSLSGGSSLCGLFLGGLLRCLLGSRGSLFGGGLLGCFLLRCLLCCLLRCQLGSLLGSLLGCGLLGGFGRSCVGGGFRGCGLLLGGLLLRLRGRSLLCCLFLGSLLCCLLMGGTVRRRGAGRRWIGGGGCFGLRCRRWGRCSLRR